MISNRGFTLTEILLALGVGSIFLFLTMQIQSQFMIKSVTSIDTLDQVTDMSSLFTWIQRNGVKKNLVIYGFTGSASGQNGVARAIVPVPNKCADLSTDCPSHTALLMATTDLRFQSMATAICALDSSHIIVDLSYGSFGVTSLVSDGISVGATNSVPAGKITIINNSPFLLINDPEATLFVATGSPSKFDPSFDAVTGLYGHPQFAANPTCISYTRNPSQLIQIPIKPYLLPNSGAFNPDPNLVLSAMGAFPVRITEVKFFALGRDPDAALNIKTGGRWGAINCDKIYPNSCKNLSTSHFIDKIDKVEVFEYFKVGLGLNPISQRYSIGKPISCLDKTCLNLIYPSEIKYSIAGEKEESLEATEFSYIKQNQIEKIEFQIEDRSGGVNSIKRFSKESSLIRRYYIETL